MKLYPIENLKYCGPGNYFTDDKRGTTSTKVNVDINSPLCITEKHTISTKKMKRLLRDATDNQHIISEYTKDFIHVNLAKLLIELADTFYNNDISLFGKIVLDTLGYDSIMHIRNDLSIIYVPWATN